MWSYRANHRLLLCCLFLSGLLIISPMGDMIIVNQTALAAKDGRQSQTRLLSPDSFRSIQSLYLQGVGFLRNKDARNAIGALDSILIDRYRPSSKVLLLQAFIMNDQVESARRLVDELGLDSDQLVNLAVALQWPNDRKPIEMLAQEAMRLGGGSNASRRWLGLWSVASGQPAQAIQIIGPIISDDDDYLWSQLGWAYYSLGDYEQAVQAFSRSVALQPNATLYRLRLAQAYQARIEAGDLLRAQRILKPLVLDNPHVDAETWYTLGWNHYLLGEATDAIEAFEAVTQMAPDINLYWLRLAQALVQRGQPDDLDRAVAILRELTLDDPNLAEAVDLLSRLDVK